jgi:chorismate--pyruvate lyase
MFKRRRPKPAAALREPDWMAYGNRRPPGIGAREYAWLSDHGSLTRSVVAACDGRFAVQLVRQERASAMPSEAALLDAGPAQATLVREVRLLCGRHVWVFARTLMPLGRLRGPIYGLTRLGQRPLGEVLFSDPTTRRLCVEIARITPRHRLFVAATAHMRRPPQAISGRRTLFDYRGERILVNELFLPGIDELKR